ncbi:MAG: hypothetical protein COU31_01945 [Candidatus Magasanikbacteria bacterium CG10_big_fil_rev_8_21_14_0_10_40_10]|uniref:DUF3147 domain-containing protein n=1 Tax=Candidatus Magasanikbacteria bacterium CG10_big_fil_rev_8_21_14_0_10_40_10 TaxID=1974648 RepID=A0A2M6W496_9BACT|nr:MAG: hypothetical protein COU31_01945 [Candidatus Magasanikbacteria bacterium CG10_big_fil_rev_8_21_14_0_10_40_10]
MDIFWKSLVSALATAIILIIAKYFGPKIAGAIGGLPIVFAVSYILLTLGDKTAAKGFLIGGVYGAVVAIFFCLILLALNFYFIKSHWLNFALAYVLCFGLVLMMINLSGK